jgi:hypothetical protein
MDHLLRKRRGSGVGGACEARAGAEPPTNGYREARYPTCSEMSRDLYTVAASMGRDLGPALLAD